jgi:hypothetical protein
VCAAAVAGWTLLSFVVTGSRCSKLAAKRKQPSAQGQPRAWRGADQRALGQPLGSSRLRARQDSRARRAQGRRGSPTAVCRAGKWGAAALKRPGAPPAAAYCRSLARIVKVTRKCQGLGAAKPRFGPA